MAETDEATPERAWGAFAPKGVSALCIGTIRSGLVHGVMRRPFRRIMQIRSPAYDVEVDGIKLRCWIGENFTEQMLVERGLHKDAPGVQRIERALSPGDVFVDIGANCGLFTLFAARAVGPRGRVLAIEPSPKMAQRIRFNVAANAADHVTIVQAAVGAEDGNATLYGGNHPGLASLCADVGGSGTEVPVAPLLSLVERANLDRIDVLKIDIEGYEDRALVPFLRTAEPSLWPRLILIEKDHAARWEMDCLAALHEAGYRDIWTDGSDLLLERPREAASMPPAASA